MGRNDRFKLCAKSVSPLDGGQNWQPQTVEVLVSLCSVLRYGSGSEVWITGYSGTILHSADGGERWSTAVDGRHRRRYLVVELMAVCIGSKHAQHRHLLAVFSVASQLWAVGYDGVILHSADRGRTWQPRRT